MNDREREFKRHGVCWLAVRTEGELESVRQQSVTSAAEQTGGDSQAPSFTAVIRSSRTAHHMGWHSLFIPSLALHTWLQEERGTHVCVCLCVC